MNIYQNFSELVRPYFSSLNTAEIFPTRQCESHLQRKPAEMGMHDLVNPAKWAVISGDLQIGREKSKE